MSEKGEYVKFKSYERKTKSPFMIYVDLCHKIMESKIQNSLYEQISKTCYLQLWQ